MQPYEYSDKLKQHSLIDFVNSKFVPNCDIFSIISKTNLEGFREHYSQDIFLTTKELKEAVTLYENANKLLPDSKTQLNEYLHNAFTSAKKYIEKAYTEPEIEKLIEEGK
jgi:hypothetical protein